MERTGGRRDREEGNLGEPGRLRGLQARPDEPMCCSLHQKLLRLEEGGCLGSTQTRLRRVRAPHSFILAVGAAAMLCSRLSGGWRCWRSTRMTLFWKYVPAEHSVSLGHPSPEPAKPLGPALLTIVLALSLIALLGKGLARARAKPARAVAPFGALEPKTGFFLPFFFLSFFVLSQAHFSGR